MSYKPLVELIEVPEFRPALDCFSSLIRDIRYVHLIGEPAAVSQYGLAYDTFVNGFIKELGSVVQYVEPDQIAKAFKDLFDKKFAQGQNVIVWRVLPQGALEHDFDYEKDLYKVRIRCHFMTMDELVNAIAKASD